MNDKTDFFCLVSFYSSQPILQGFMELGKSQITVVSSNTFPLYSLSLVTRLNSLF